VQPLISLNIINKHFGGVQALKGISLQIRPAEVHCLAGENGSGKSTLIKVIAGIHRPDGGRILTRGKSYHHLTTMESMRLGIQVIYQDFSLFPNLTVAENLALNCQLEQNKTFVSWKSVRQTAKRALQGLGITMDLDARLGELPIGQKQLVAIARALLQDAKLIIMDEPTTALTGLEVDTLFKIIRTLKDRGVAILFVSHKLREMLRIGDRFTVLRNGEVVAEGPVSEFDQSKIAFYMTGRRLDSAIRRTQEETGRQSLLKVRGLTGSILCDLSFELFAGEILGLTGLLGSGQTELALALFGMQPCRSGDMFVRGERRVIRSIQDAIAVGIAYVPEDRLTEGLFLAQSVERNVVAANLLNLRNRFSLVSLRRLIEHASHRLTELGVTFSSRGIPVKTLSGGNQQRVVLAKWLATKPEILVLNGPTVGVDIGSKQEIHKLFQQLAANGIGIIMISDDLPELAQNCNRILILSKGRLSHELKGSECDESRIEHHLAN